MTRNYLRSDIKILWGESGCRCAFPGCRRELVEDATALDPKQVLGKIAHIVADSDTGPRGDVSMPADERRREPNLLLLCGTHHDIVDGQPNSYTVADLRTWKADHVEWVRSRLTDAVAGVDFAELQRLTELLVLKAAPRVADVAPPTPPPEKLRTNDLTVAIATRLQIGSLRFLDVEEFVARTTQSDDGFGERLKAGFRERYDSLIDGGVSGDELFEEVVDWASGGSTDFDVMAAALAVVTYLFTICDLFEP
jgi:hypothetical protein